MCGEGMDIRKDTHMQTKEYKIAIESYVRREVRPTTRNRLRMWVFWRCDCIKLNEVSHLGNLGGRFDSPRSLERVVVSN